MHKILISALLLLMSISLPAQNNINPCGTKDGKSEWLIKYQSNPNLHEKSDDPLYVALAIHIVGDSNGNGYYPKSKVFDALCVLNEDYEAANIHFYTTTDFEYINNSNYYQHTFGQGSNMMSTYYTLNKIDCYIVDDPAGNCGYSSYGDGVALNKACLSPTDHTWAHELGHYFSLPHTFFGLEGTEIDYADPIANTVNGLTTEKVDGSNCTYAADSFCDTPPDYLNFRWTCNAQGMSTQIQHDANGAAFRSDGSYYMSYSDGPCKSQFSEEEIAAMRANIEGPQSFLQTNATPLEDIPTNPVNLTYPIQGEVAPANGGTITLTWDAMENATGYIIQVNPFPNFGSAIIEEQVSAPQVTISDLEIGKKYYWRVRAFSEWSSCSPFSPSTSFKVGTPVAVSDLSHINNLSIMPNPAAWGQDIWIKLDAQVEEVIHFTILNTQGKLVSQSTTDVHKGNQNISLSTNYLEKGIYFLQIQSPQGFYYEKFIIQ